MSSKIINDNVLIRKALEHKNGAICYIPSDRGPLLFGPPLEPQPKSHHPQDPQSLGVPSSGCEEMFVRISLHLM